MYVSRTKHIETTDSIQRWGLHSKFGQIREILKTQREKRLDEVLEILREKERELQKKNNNGRDNQETAYATRNHHKKNNKKKCFVCGKIGHLPKNCYHRKDKQEQEISGNSSKNRKDNNSSNANKNTNFASEQKPDFNTFQALNVRTCPKLGQYEWIVDSGCTSHMTFNKKYFIDYKPSKGKVYLAGRNNELESKGIGSL